MRIEKAASPGQKGGIGLDKMGVKMFLVLLSN